MRDLLLPKKHHEAVAMAYVKRALEAFGKQVAENMRQNRHLKDRKFQVEFTKPKLKVCKIIRNILEHSYQDIIDYTVIWDTEHLVVQAKFKKEPNYGQIETSTQHQADLTQAEAKEGIVDQIQEGDDTTVIDLDGNDLK